MSIPLLIFPVIHLFIFPLTLKLEVLVHIF